MRILDPELNPIRDFNINVGANLQFLSTVSNGTSIAMKFFDHDNSLILTKIFSLNGDLILDQRYKLNNAIERMSMNSLIADYATDGLTAIPGVGYLNILPKKREKMSYKSYLLGDDGSTTAMEAEYNLNRAEGSNYIAYNEDIIYTVVASAPTAVSLKGIQVDLIGFDVNTKEQVFKKQLDTYVYLMSSHIEGENLSLYGVAFKEDSRFLDKVESIIKLTIDKQGNVISDYRHKFDYDKLFTEKQIKKGNKLFPHEIFVDKDNNIHIIAEMMKTKNSTSSRDIHILKFNSKFEMMENNLFPTVKFDNGEYCPTAQYYCMMIKSSSYKFLQRNEDDYSITYFNNDEKGRGYYEVLSNLQGEFQNEKIYGNEKGVIRYVKKAKYGYVLLFDYNYKKYTVSLSLEKLNI